MTPSQLLNRIEQLGIVDEKYITRIRKQIDDPDKVVKPKAVVGYLLKKKQLNQQQAAALLKPPTEDELEVVQPIENDYDTGALIGDDIVEPILDDVIEPIEEIVPTIDATMMDDGTFHEGDVDVVDVQPIEEPALVDPLDLDTAPSIDPLGGDFDNGGFNNDAGFSSGAYATQSGAQKTVPTFAGKKDSSDQFQTKWLYIGFGLLGSILIGTALFYILLAGQTPDEMLKAIQDAYIAQSYGDCVKKCDNFLEKFPNNPEAPEVRTKRVHCILRGTYEAKNYAELIPQAEKLLTELAAEEDTKIEIIRDDIAVILPSAFMQLTDRSAKSMVSDGNDIDIESMKQERDRVLEFKKVIDNPVFISNSKRKQNLIANNLSAANNNVQTIEGLIKKETEYVDGLKKIDALRLEGKTDEGFKEYRRLKRLYGDIAARDQIRELMLKISEKESELVKPITLELTPTSESRPSKIESTVVLSVTTGTPVKSLMGEVVPMLVEGTVYGVDAGSGAIAWRRFIGFQSMNQPVELDAERTLISDLLNNDLLCVKTSNGELIWRQAVGDGFETPAINTDKIVLSTNSGHVIALNPANGEFINAAKLPQATGASAVISERDPYIYQIGKYSNLYVLSAQSFECEEVYSLDHEPGSVAIAPVQWTGYILIAQNGGGYCDLHVLKPQKNGLGLVRVQKLQRVVDSPVSLPFVRAGRSLLMIGDNGQIQLLDIDPTNEAAPIQMLGKVQFGDPGDIHPMLSASGSRVWIAGDGIVNARIRRNQGTIERDVAKEARDQFLTSAKKLDDYVLHIRRRVGSGMLSACLASDKTLDPVWSTEFGGDLAGDLLEVDGKVKAINNQGDLFTIDEASIESGFSNSPVRGSTVIEDLQFSKLIPLSNGVIAATGPRGKSDLLYINGNDNKLVGLSPPADKPTAGALAVGENLVIPSSTGHVAMVAPRTGTLVGAPFQRPVSPIAQINWLQPLALNADTIAVASAESKGETSKLFILSTKNQRSIQEVGSLEVPAPFKNIIATDGKSIFGVLDKDGNDALAAFSTTAPVTQSTTLDLDGDCVQGPWHTEAGIFVKLDNDRLYCFDKNLQQKWSVEVPNVRFASPPEVAGASLRLVYQNGLVSLLDQATGQTTSSIELGQPINHRPLSVGGKVYFSGLDGTIHVYNPQK